MRVTHKQVTQSYSTEKLKKFKFVSTTGQKWYENSDQFMTPTDARYRNQLGGQIWKWVESQ